MGMRGVRLGSLVVSVVLGLATAVPAAAEDASNKWRLQCSGNAESSGEIVLAIEPKGATALEVKVPVAKGTSENRVAQTIRDALTLQLPENAYKVEVDDGEDVLIKKKGSTPNFGFRVVSNSVSGVRLSPDKE